MSGEIHTGPLEPASAPSPRRRLRRLLAARRLAAASRPPRLPAAKRSWRERRWARRRQRRRIEEALGWVLVPLILVGCYWVTKATLNAFGTSPTAVLQALRITSG